MRAAATAYVPFFSLAVLLAVTHSASAPTPASKAASDEDRIEWEIRAVEQKEAQALLRGDAAALADMWAPDLLVTASNNTIRSGAEILGLIRSGQMNLIRLDRRVERVAVHGQVAVAMGVETLVPAGGQNAGKTVSRRYTDVYAREGNRWLLIARQATLVPNDASGG